MIYPTMVPSIRSRVTDNRTYHVYFWFTNEVVLVAAYSVTHAICLGPSSQMGPSLREVAAKYCIEHSNPLGRKNPFINLIEELTPSRTSFLDHVRCCLEAWE